MVHVIFLVAAVAPILAAFVAAIRAALAGPRSGRAVRVVSAIGRVACGIAVGCGVGAGSAAVVSKVAFPDPRGAHGFEGLAGFVFTILGGAVGLVLGAVVGSCWAILQFESGKAKPPDAGDEP